MNNPQLPPLFETRNGSGLLGKLLTAAAAIALVVAGAVFSLLIFAAAAVVGVAVFLWLWWKTRGLERELTERIAQMKRDGVMPDSPSAADAVTIEGEATRVDPPGK